MFNGCSFQTCIYGTFKSHKSRNHTPHTLKDFKPEILKTTAFQSLASSDQLLDYQEEEEQGVDEELSCEVLSPEQSTDAIEQLLATTLLQLEYLVHVPVIAVDSFLQELNYIISSASATVSSRVVKDILKQNQVQFEDSLVKDIITALSSSNPVCRAIEKGGCLSTHHRRLKYYKEKFSVVEPVTYLLGKKANFQYVPILKLLQQVLNCKSILDTVLAHYQGKKEFLPGPSQEFKSPEDGKFFTENGLLNADQITISVRLYVDEFEVCNPLGTSRKVHKLCGVYWVLGNLPPGSQSALSSIYLAALFKSVDGKEYGYERVLEPLLQDLQILKLMVYLFLCWATLLKVQCSAL